jgi:thymidylate synthase
MFKAQFLALLAGLDAKLLDAPVVVAPNWQSVKAPQPMVELLNTSFSLDLDSEVSLSTSLESYRQAIRPNLPWADLHFERERVSRDPLNPGTAWKIWPYAKSADLHRREGEENPQFDHSYAERYWPKFAGRTTGGVLSDTPDPGTARQGYRFPYGDLDDLVEVLLADPLTRQAYLPVWFPEDLGAARMSKRVPCTLGYHFLLRRGKLHLVYPMRSCDYLRHFRDDVYLTIRLLLWVLEQCKLADPNTWGSVAPGTFTMHITSLHVFLSDRELLQKSVQRRW